MGSMYADAMSAAVSVLIDTHIHILKYIMILYLSWTVSLETACKVLQAFTENRMYEMKFGNKTFVLDLGLLFLLNLYHMTTIFTISHNPKTMRWLSDDLILV